MGTSEAETPTKDMVIKDKKYFVEQWKTSVVALLVYTAVVVLDNGRVLKWVLLALLVILFSISKELRLTADEKLIEQNLNIFGLRKSLLKIPIDKVWEFSVRQNSTNRYDLLVQMTSGEKIVLLTEDSRVEVDLHLAALKKFTGT